MMGEPLLLAATGAAGLEVWKLALLAAISLGVGVLGGFVGLALGTMRLPALLLMGVPAPVAAGTNILTSTASAITGAAPHIQAGRVVWRVVLVMGVPSVAGALVGGLFGGAVDEWLLEGAAGGLVAWQGVELFQRGRRERRRAAAVAAAAAEAAIPTSDTASAFTPKRLAIESAIGLAIGLVGGAVGLILGSLRLPALIRILRINPRQAVGTNLVIGAVMGLFGFIGHGIQGELDIPLLVSLGVPGVVGSLVGARLTGRVSIASLLLTMGIILAVVGALLIRQAVVVYPE